MEQGRKRILIVDDDETIRTALTDFFLIKGYYAVNAETGPLALAMLPIFRPDLVLLDIFMPGMDGLAVLKRMKEWNPDLVVVMLTGANDLSTAQAAMRAGANDYLTKPFRYNQLETVISVHLLLHSGA